MSNAMTNAIWFLLVLWCCILLHLATDQRDTLKKEAVDRGYAEWVVNASGDAKWQWKEAK